MRESFTEEMTTGQGLKNEWNFNRLNRKDIPEQGTGTEESVEVNEIE